MVEAVQWWSTGVGVRGGAQSSATALRNMSAGTLLCVTQVRFTGTVEEAISDSVVTKAELPSGDVVEVLPDHAVAATANGWVSATPLGVFSTGVSGNVGFYPLASEDVPGLADGAHMLLFETTADVAAGDTLTLVPFCVAATCADRRSIAKAYGAHLLDPRGANAMVPLQDPEAEALLHEQCTVMDTAFAEAVNHIHYLLYVVHKPLASCDIIFRTVEFMLMKLCLPALEPLPGAPSTPNGRFTFSALQHAWPSLLCGDKWDDDPEMQKQCHDFLQAMMQDESSHCMNTVGLLHLRLVIMMQSLLRTWLPVLTQPYVNKFVTNEADRHAVVACIVGGRALLAWTVRYLISWVAMHAPGQPRHELLYSTLMLQQHLRHTHIELWRLLLATPEWDDWRDLHMEVGSMLDEHTAFVLKLVGAVRT